MKAISASIIVLAASILVAGGALVQHADTSITVTLIGGFVGLLGLAFWIKAVSSTTEK